MRSEDDDKRLRALLSDPAIHADIRKVARLRGATRDKADDVVQQVLREALEGANVPLHDREQGRLYLCGMARYVHVDGLRTEARDKDYVDEKKRDARGGDRGNPEAKLVAWSIAAWGEKVFGVRFGWYLRHTIHGESQAAIAESAGVTEEAVQKAIGRIRRGIQMAAGALVIASVFAFATWRTKTSHDRLLSQPDFATVGSSHRTPGPPPMSPQAEASRDPLEDLSLAQRAALLRERARREMKAGEWSSCMADIAEARQDDPAGHTADVQKTLDTCLKGFDSLFAKPH